ncbi:MAG: hypothetical protein J6U65_06035 [Bacteroidaceae bacterium]|nr:hypothetical protein [Bacteroidaceae bacterium]
MALAAGSSMTSCIDDTYDMSKDIDMTMGLGSQGLQLKVGNTEKIWLSDVLEVDKEEMLETTSSGTFYLVKADKADFSFNVPSFNASVNVAKLTPNLPMLTFDDLKNALAGAGVNINELTISKDWTTKKVPLKVESTDLFTLSNLPKEIKNLKRIIPAKESSKVKVSLEIIANSTNQKFVIDSYNNLQVTLPDFFKLKGRENNKIDLGSGSNLNTKNLTIAEFEVEALELEGEKGVDLSNGKNLEVSGHYAVSGDFSIKASEKFVVKSGDETTIRVTIQIGDQKGRDKVNVSFAEVQGVFNPDINPNISPINISKDIPEFLTDPEVRIMASNPTFRLDVNMNQVPVDLNLWGKLYGVKGGKNIAEVRIPGTNVVSLTGKKESVIYFCQEEQPFDPNGVAQGANIYRINNLNDVVETIPDVIKVDFNDNKISLSDKLTSIGLGKQYKASLDYSVYVPFKFNSGLKIVYDEVIEDMNDDLQDLAAEGAKISAVIDNKVPLELQLTAVLLDKKGNEIPGVTVSTLEVPANAETPIDLTVKFANPTDLQKLDQISLKVKAQTVANGVTLTSDQYIQLNDIRLTLLGQIIADLN